MVDTQSAPGAGADTASHDADAPLWLRSRDMEEARELFRNLLGFASVCDPRHTDQSNFDLQVRATSVAPVYVGSFSSRTEMTVYTPDLQDRYAFALPHRGILTVEQRGDTVGLRPDAGAMCATEPDGVVGARFSPQSGFFAVYIDHHTVARELEEELGHSVQQYLRFPDLGLDYRTPGLQLFHQMAQLIGTEIENPGGLLKHPSVAKRMGAALVSTMLHSVPHQYSEALSNSARPGPAPVRRVTDAMHADPAHPFTQTELAGIAGVPLRSLQNAFRAHHGQPLMTYLRNLRLDRTHADLHSEQPPGTTVAEIAVRWGFFHHSRFSAYYKQRFGVLPSQDRPR
ncbi:AraC family transcriptional regulator [Streptomyces sp. NPDC004111]|uniref:AraC family transcriptional regulator n=1 Tax=Streptomyces sp. NPDC004111 TaxID=3364690 RepID=UPI0036D11A3F